MRKFDKVKEIFAVLKQIEILEIKIKQKVLFCIKEYFRENIY